MKALLLAMLFAPLAWAEGETRFYEVEVLIFQNARDPATIDERIERGVRPEDRPTQQLILDADFEGDYLTLAPYAPEERLLNEQSLILQRQGKVVLFHERWMHGLKSAGQDTAIAIQGGQDLGYGRGYELEGSIEFSIDRFIEAKVDLVTRHLVDGSPEGPFTAHLKETRRARSGVVHYLDHPMIGVLITYTRTEDS